MSRIGKQPVPIAAGVQVSLAGRTLAVEGPKGKLTIEFRPEVSVSIDPAARQVHVARVSQDRLARALHGTTRAAIQNMIVGVTAGYEKQLEVVGVGYVCSIKGQNVSLRVGFANEVQRPIPAALQVTCPDQTHITIRGCDKQLVGQFAAELRALRKPEPYKGKGVRYVGEQVKIKPGKAAG